MGTKGTKVAPKYKDPEGRVLAMKGDLQKWFGIEAWRIGGLEKHGWVKVGVMSDAVKVEAEEIKISEIPTTEVKEPEDTPTDGYPSEDEMKDFLKEKGVRFSPNIGIEKLKQRYDESNE